MGSVDIVPGVSGGTIALVTGIYPDFIAALHSINLKFIKTWLEGQQSEARQQFQKIHWQFLLALGLGLLIAPFMMSHIIVFLMASYPGYLFGFFFGLIVASSILILKRLVHVSPRTLIFMVIGLALAYVLSGLSSSAQLPHTPLFLFLCGFIGISAMILPGISGAFIAYLLGQYTYMIEAIRTFHVALILVYSGGSALGMITFARIVGFLLKRYENATLAFLIGLMIGALRLPLTHIVRHSDSWWISGTMALVAFALMMMVDFLRRKSLLNP